MARVVHGRPRTVQTAVAMRLRLRPRSSLSALRPPLPVALAAAGVTAWWWERRTRAQARRTARLHRSLVDVLLNVLSAGDLATEAHARRVADLVDVLARELALDRRARSTLRVAALLHDVGKVDERFFRIVHSPQPLSPEQLREMRGHPAQSAHILEPVEWAHPGITGIVGSHHERWDGRGYPRGLRGEQVPLGARIIALADTFDAMTRSRPYRSGTSPRHAFDELRRGAGHQFDPELVRVAGRRRLQRRWEQVVRRTA